MKNRLTYIKSVYVRIYNSKGIKSVIFVEVDNAWQFYNQSRRREVK